ncbi:distal membrane-arm assembly complex protein 2 [Copidosoma floridanum]|uniref:distal membrane-arm assembly complex protein 2 n=1 Tax=Copidosoma floridanum TaxID=29053 RepID=UPI0006C986F1|nr:distal membrane-arm assembly complex protein 2 [Copidosoma floridanum]
MLSLKVFDAVKLSKNIILPLNIQPLSTSASLMMSSKRVKRDPDEVRKEEQLYGLKMHKGDSLVKDDYVDKHNVRRTFFEMDIEAFKLFQADIEFSTRGIKKFLQNKSVESMINAQSYKEDNVKFMGSDIAAAQFVLLHDGKVKFKHSEKWMGASRRDFELLPSVFDPNYIITQIDLSDVEIFYEGLENFKNCPRIKTAIFQRSPLFDEWFADRISHLFPSLEYLDLTDCPKVNERALEAFYRFSTLKTLIVTNNNKSSAFELSCMMLEDVVPGLTVKILEPNEERESSNEK